MSAVLITGGAGFIGANFVRYWRAKHPEDVVCVIDALTYAGNPANLAGLEDDDRLIFVKGDIVVDALLEQLLAEHHLDTIVHFAAESHVDRSIHGPDEFVRTNVVGTHSLLKAARAVWMAKGTPRANVRFHHVSTDEVYGSLDADDPPATEANSYRPNSPYAASKAGADHLVRAYYKTYGLPVTISNCSNNYGPYQFPEKLIPLMLINALRGISLPLYGDGRNVRDWIHVRDHCAAIDVILSRGRPGETYNVGGDEEWSNVAIVDLLCRQIDALFAADPELRTRFPDSPAARGERTATLLTYVKDRPGHDRRYALNSAKIRTELGFSLSEPFEAGVRDTLLWYFANEPWWRGVIDGSYHEWVAKHYTAA